MLSSSRRRAAVLGAVLAAGLLVPIAASAQPASPDPSASADTTVTSTTAPTTSDRATETGAPLADTPTPDLPDFNELLERIAGLQCTSHYQQETFDLENAVDEFAGLPGTRYETAYGLLNNRELALNNCVPSPFTAPLATLDDGSGVEGDQVSDVPVGSADTGRA